MFEFSTWDIKQCVLAGRTYELVPSYYLCFQPNESEGLIAQDLNCLKPHLLHKCKQPYLFKAAVWRSFSFQAHGSHPLRALLINPAREA